MVGGGGLPAGGAMVPTGGSVAPVPVPVQAPTGPITLNQEQLTKLNSELETVQQNCKVFNEMLTEMTPGQEDASDLELLQVRIAPVFFTKQKETNCDIFRRI